MSELNKYLEQLKELKAINDEKNPSWYQAKFYQLQILQERAQPEPICRYHGQNDYRFIEENGKIIDRRLTDKPPWLVNSDNRTIKFPLGSNSSKLIKFYLVRTKVAFEVSYEKDGIVSRKPIGLLGKIKPNFF